LALQLIVSAHPASAAVGFLLGLLTEGTPMKNDLPRPPDLIGLAHVSGELKKVIDDPDAAPTHRALYNKKANGELPMIVFIRGRYYLPRADLPALAQSLGLRLKRRNRSSSRRAA
jgi:hypothetical protein